MLTQVSRAALGVALLCAGSVTAQTAPWMPGARPAYEYRGGLWFDGSRFVPRTVWSEYGLITDRRPAIVDSVIDLAGLHVIPAFADAHNHNVELPRFDASVALHLKDGVFYVKNPASLPASTHAIRSRIDTPQSVDAVFALGALTGPEGHPAGVIRRLIDAGIREERDAEGGFFWEIATEADLDRKWPGILALRPDFIKIILHHSEHHHARDRDTTYRFRRGLDPGLVAPIVRRAHAAGLTVAAHVESAADFRTAVANGVDEVSHLPGFRGDGTAAPPPWGPYALTAADAREAARRGTIVVTTIRGAEADPDTAVRAAYQRLFRHNLSLLRDAGVRLAIGSDAYGSSSGPQMRSLAALGVFTNLELLLLWSDATPRAIFPARRIGRLDPGYEASFLALDGDPLADFSATSRIRLRVKQGLLLPPF